MGQEKIKLVGLYISTILSMLMLLLSLFLMIVDPAAIIFTYASVLFIIPSILFKRKKITRIYMFLFLIANSIFAFYIYKDSISSASISHNYTSNPFLQ